MRYKIVCIVQIYNELRKGNLERFVKYVTPLVDELVVYDDASTDGSYEYMLDHASHVIRGTRNDFANEISHKQALLEYALKLVPDFILWLDADEVLTRNAETRLQELCAYCVENGIDGMSLHELNLWRSYSWRRVDNAYDDGWFVRLWRVTRGMSFTQAAPGLHQAHYPPSIQKIERATDVQVIHYGFASERWLAYKYLTYKTHGQSGWALDRLLDETTLKLEKVPPEVFPEGLWADDKRPEKRSFRDALRSAEQYRAEVFVPGVSIICLIYKSVKWLEFVYEQVLRYTDLSNKEFFFVANDASETVLCYLRDHYIPHVIWNNTLEQHQEWYINNVYRAWNYGARVARGDYLLFINSDMAFSPGWFERLFEKLNGRNCVTARLTESGKLTSGEYAISQDFGRSVEEYDEDSFLNYAKSISESAAKDGGLFMPLLIRRADFLRVSGYPEGNIVPGSDLLNPSIAKKGEPCVSGDAVLMQKLQSIGIQHQTTFDSIVYHFQCGEMDESPSEVVHQTKPSVIICNDYLRGRMGEKVMWGFLLDSLPNSAGVDMTVVGTDGDFAHNAWGYIQRCYPQSAIIVQNATFIDLVDPDRFTIAYLQDNLREMGRPSEQQERNLHRADLLVTNSRLTALSYPEFQFEVIPIGVDATLFRPMDKTMLRREFGFPSGKIGIFVGDFTEVKGWSKVQQLVEGRKDIFWILVSKDKKTYQADNCRTYNMIEQSLLAKLLNCADFFIIGSSVETECLAAVEACMCDIPVVMRKTGVFADFTKEERTQTGVFSDDFEQAVDLIFARSFSPRKVMLDKGLSLEAMICRWVKVLQQAHLTVALRNAEMQNKNRAQMASTDMLPLVSIITPAYNRASYLDETIQSVLKQDYPRIEYIVLDDGSTDNTKEVLEKYTGRVIWETHPNMGETRTVNKGWSMAHGEIVAVVNSDDPLLPGAVSVAVAFMRSHPDILVAYPDWDFIDQGSNVTGHIQVREYDYLYMVRRHDCTPGPGVFIRRKAFELTEMRDPEFKYVADFEYWLRLGLYGKFARIPKTLATFRVHPDSTTVSHRGAAMATEHIRLVKKFYSRPDLPTEARKVRAEALCWAHIVAGIACGRAHWPAYRHYFQAMLYHPRAFSGALNVWILGCFGRWTTALSQVLPRPLFKVLQWGWQITKKGRRLVMRSLVALGK
jgi:glycosyltransferase involved in cell wall biosynthesis